MNTMIQNGPWTFNQHILILWRLQETNQVDKIPLNQIALWVQIHHLPVGFHSSKISQNISNYVGSFLEADENNFTGTWRTYLRIRLNMDIGKPLKYRMRIKKPDSEWLWVEFRYERLTTFCFICGCLGHIDRKCMKIYDYLGGNVPKLYGSWMRATNRRVQNTSSERWFRLAPTSRQEGEPITNMDNM